MVHKRQYSLIGASTPVGFFNVYRPTFRTTRPLYSSSDACCLFSTQISKKLRCDPYILYF
jgi:hypothetical protein